VSNVPWADLLKQSEDALKPIPDGDYNVKVVDARVDKSSTGKMMIRVKFEVTSGPHATRRIPTQFVLSDENPTAVAIWFRQMAAMGLDATFFQSLPTGDQGAELVAQALLNRVCRITLGTRAWQGVDRNDVKAVLPPLTGGPVAPGTVTGPAPVGGPTPPGASPMSSSTSAPPVPTPASTPAAAPASPTPELPF
jgi:hypothetical protein